MKKLVLVLAALPVVAFAGKLERKYIKEEINPAVTKAEADVKKACGCSWKISFDAKDKKVDDMGVLKHLAENIGEGAAAACDDDDAKKAMCVVSAVKMGFGPEVKIKVEGSTAHMITYGGGMPTMDMLATELDK